MSEIFDETNMWQSLGNYIPEGEILLAGIHALAKESRVRCVFGKCYRTENGLVPDEDGGSVALEKAKFSTYDIYFGITQSSMVITECEKGSYFYEFNDEPNVRGMDIQEVEAEIFFEDIGTCFPLADIQSCRLARGWMGSVKCFITMKNGSSFKLLLPKLGGVGGGMPNRAKYREAIIERLSGIGE